jgi:hypothetical protein
LRELRAHRIRHRTRRNRREVTVPYRVLPDSEVSGVLGCPFPVRRWRSLNAPSFRYFFLRPRQRMRLRGQSSPGVRPSYTVFPKPPPPVSRPEAPLLGFHAATTHWEKRVHVRLSPAPRFCRGICPRVPPRRLRCRSQVFPTSQRPSSSLHRPTIFRWVASVRFALQGFVPLTKPRPTRRRAAYPLDVAPAG